MGGGAAVECAQQESPGNGETKYRAHATEYSCCRFGRQAPSPGRGDILSKRRQRRVRRWDPIMKPRDQGQCVRAWQTVVIEPEWAKRLWKRRYGFCRRQPGAVPAIGWGICRVNFR